MKILPGSDAIPCPECGKASRVINSRAAEVIETPAIYRRRACRSCDHRWSTFEIDAGLLKSLIEDADG